MGGEGEPPRDWPPPAEVLRWLRATLDALAAIDTPGAVVNLPFEWPESPKEVRSQSIETPPIGSYLQRNPWDLPRLLYRKVPQPS